jgi:3',5'-nucleoside bisphosphate phosphatase
MEEINYNLHNHTYYSDGEVSPTELVRLNKKNGFNVIAITDHDNIEGINEAIIAGKRFGVLVIPGVEISTSKSHILGLFIDPKNPELISFLKKRAIEKKAYANYLINGLAKRGYKLTPEMIQKATNSHDLTPGRASLTLVHAGLVKDEKTANTLIKSLPRFKGPTNARSIESVSEIEAIRLIKKARGAPILAHPFHRKQKLRYLIMPFRAFLLKRAGLVGLEVQHPDHSKLERGFLHSISTLLFLRKTGGSDFHNPNSSQINDWKRIKQSKGVKRSIKKLQKHRP